MNSRGYLISIAVGPVQEFIASARKLRDLWYGSDLLSELSKSVVRSLSQQDCELIFPAVANVQELQKDSNLIVANKILALAAPDHDPDAILQRAKADYLTFWYSHCEQVRSGLPDDCIDQITFDAQVKDFGEFYGVWAEIKGDNQDTRYKETRSRTEQLLAGRKSLREFEKPTWEGAGKQKSSLDGIRENVITKSTPFENRFLLKKNEKLDALGIVKRKGISEKNRLGRPWFESLSQVAVLPYLDGLKQDPKAKELFKSFPDLSTLPDLKMPPQKQTNLKFLPKDFPVEWLLPACRAELERDFRLKDHQTWKDLNRKMAQLYAYTGQPHPYACLLVGDGDHMGEALGNLKYKKDHQRFSASLDSFARSMQDIIPTFYGGLIYSGGDDVMAYLPLHKALVCASAIKDRFAEDMEKACTETGIQTPTFSIGIAIVHHHMPLHRALELARRAEQTAKNQGGRNSLAIIQAKRGGSEQTIFGKWQAQGDLEPFNKRLEVMTQLFKPDDLSSRLAYQLRRIGGQSGQKLEYEMVDGALLPKNATSAEALRLIWHKQPQSGKSITKKDAITMLAGRKLLRPLADELVIAQQFANAIGLSEKKWSNKEETV